MALETFKCFAEWSGLENLGSMVAAVGAQTVKDFPEYLEEAKELGKKIQAKAVEK